MVTINKLITNNMHYIEFLMKPREEKGIITKYHLMGKNN